MIATKIKIIYICIVFGLKAKKTLNALYAYIPCKCSVTYSTYMSRY